MQELFTRHEINIHDVDMEKFVAAVNSCRGAVWLETEEGDKLNLKSMLCRIVGLTSMIKGGRIANATIRCENADDDGILFRLKLWNKVG